MYITSVSYLVNEHDRKDRLVQMIRGPVMDTTEVHSKYKLIRVMQKVSAGQGRTLVLTRTLRFFRSASSPGPSYLHAQ